MPFVKGQSGNPKGRKKGSLDKRTEAWNNLGEFITEEGAQRAMRILGTLKDRDYLDQYGKLLQYFKPKRHHTQAEVESRGLDKITVEIVKSDHTDNK